MILRGVAAGALVLVATAALVLSQASWPTLIAAPLLLSLAAFVLFQAKLVYRPEGSVVHPFEGTRVSPLLDRQAAVSLWDGVPIGRTRSEDLIFSPIDTSLLVAGEPRAGKTVLLNNIITAAALDPNVRFALFDGKGSLEFEQWRPVAEVVDRTMEPQALLRYLASLINEMKQCYDALAALGHVKLTRDVCDSQMPLRLLIVDELSAYTQTFPNKKLGQEIVQSLARLAAQGPAAGVLLIMATQRTDVTVVPGILRDNVSMRISFRVPTSRSSDMILGNGMARAGYDASTIRRIDDRGIGFADIDGARPRKFKANMVSYDDTAVVAQRAAVLRGAEAVSGPAPVQSAITAPLDVRPLARDLLEDITSVWPAEEDRLHNSVILGRLQELDALYYGTWSASAFGRKLREAGLARYKVQFTAEDRVNCWGLPRAALFAHSEPDKSASKDRREREAVSMAVLSDTDRMEYEARVADIRSASRCAYCKRPFEPGETPTVEHVVPLMKGGTSHAANLVAACQSCNSSKRDTDLFDFLNKGD